MKKPVNFSEFRGYVYTVNEEIKVLELLKNSGGISFKVIHIEGVEYYWILGQIRYWEKQGLTTKINGVLGITEQGIEYLNYLTSSNK